ncbi:MAG: hypothetical protein M0P11_09715, partial [Anaerolineaceae bacterium]|nr:hypothetical protein [Anaerolineaceae bacterium]
YFGNKALSCQDASSEELMRLYRPMSNALKGLVGNDGKSRAELICHLAPEAGAAGRHKVTSLGSCTRYQL